MRTKHFILALLLGCCASLWGADTDKIIELSLPNGTLRVIPLQENAVRIQYQEGEMGKLPEWMYVNQTETPRYKQSEKNGITTLKLKAMSLKVNRNTGEIFIENAEGKTIMHTLQHELKAGKVQEENTRHAKLLIDSPTDEYIYGLGQFQDGYLNLRGLSRRLTQVNTQIAVPMMMSSRGFGLLWNNYGLTEFNPGKEQVALSRQEARGQQVEVNVTSTEGSRREMRQNNVFGAEINIKEDGQYAILLDVGQDMARRHHLLIDGKVVMDARNLWLPPTISTLVDLKAGTHQLKAELERGDKPTIYYKKVDDTTEFYSPVAECVDYTVMVGSADEIIAANRQITGQSPMLPEWAFGYIHCRERFHSQEELIATAKRFRQEQIPIDMIVQDWQYWGKYGWNSMKFDEEHYPDPAKMMNELHNMDMRLMLSVWSKIDNNAELGKIANEKGYYIPGTTWIDFFDDEAASFYWENFSNRLLKPYQIDAWWQDATEPENDDLRNRRIMKGTQPGERFRNVYPMMVNKTVYDGLRKDDPERRAMIFTRSGFTGIQRYGSVLWSGDVGNDWQTLRYQIAAGLNLMASGLPWWTYDAGGFFRPSDQYTNEEYKERLIRWVQVSTFLPLMRVHGYMSNTEPWEYGEKTKNIITNFIRLRYKLMPYIYSEAAKVSMEGGTMMRPFIFDFAHDKRALEQKQEYMFGQAILVNPITDKNPTEWTTYLPENKAGWYDMATAKWYEGGQQITTPVSIESIPLFAKGGSIIAMGQDKQSTADKTNQPTDIYVFGGDDATFELYEDEGTNYNYENGKFSKIKFQWNDHKKLLTIEDRNGSFEGMHKERIFIIHVGKETQTIEYKGKRTNIKF